MNRELPDVQAGFRKGRRTRDQIANICWIIEKAREFQKKIYFCFAMLKPLTGWITTNCGKFFNRGRSGVLGFPSLQEFSTVYCDPHSQRLWHRK